MILPHPDAPEGSVQSLKTYSPSDFPPDCAILCRNTAPLISFAFSLIRRSVGCRVLGREIGAGLVTLIKKLNASDLDELELKLDMFELREVQKFERKGEDASADAIRDKCQCLKVFIGSLLESERDIRTLCQKIQNLFDDKVSGLVTLATVHKSKGLEWPLVFILDRDLMPSKFAKLPWQQQQERNLQYVAVTRAKLDLRYITSGSWKPEETKPIKPLHPLAQSILED